MHPEGRPLAPKTVRHIALLIQDCLQQAVDWDLLVKNPMAKVKKPKVPRRRPRILDRSDFKTLVKKAIHSVYYPAVVLIDATGIRRGECLALEWSDLDWNKATLEVPKSLEETEELGLRVKGTKSGEAGASQSRSGCSTCSGSIVSGRIVCVSSTELTTPGWD